MNKTENEILEENRGLAISSVRSFCRDHTLYDFDDLLQIAMMSMLKAHRKFDPERGKFSTFATYCMRNDLIKFVNKQNKLKENKNYKEQRLSSKHDKAYEVNYWDIELPEDLSPKEHGVYYYKMQNRKDSEIRDILNLDKDEYKQTMANSFKKIAEANE